MNPYEGHCTSVSIYKPRSITTTYPPRNVRKSPPTPTFEPPVPIPIPQLRAPQFEFELNNLYRKGSPVLMTCRSNECFFFKHLKITIRFRVRSPPIDSPTKSSVSAIQLVLTRLVCTSTCVVSETNNGIGIRCVGDDRQKCGFGWVSGS